MEGKQCFGSGGIELRQVHQCRTAQRSGDVSVLPVRLGATLAVAVKLDGPDECDVAYLACERDPVIGELQTGGELF